MFADRPLRNPFLGSLTLFNFIKAKASREKRHRECTKTQYFLRLKKAETLFAWAETPGNPMETLSETLETPSETLQQTLLENLGKSSRLHKIMYGRGHSGGNVISLAYICNITQNSNREHTAVCQDLPVGGHPNTCHHAAQREHSFLRQQKTESKRQNMRSGDH